MGLFRGEDDLERELRARRPEPSRELVDGIVSRIAAERPRRSGSPVRLGLAAALTAGMLVALGAFGGLSYAANGVTHAVSSAVHVLAPVKRAAPSGGLSSARAQYRVAYCLKGNTIFVDSRAANGMENAGATPGACGSGSGAFSPATKTVIGCFRGDVIRIPAKAAGTKKEQAALKKAGISLGFCKK